jgi:hypothetical protein
VVLRWLPGRPAAPPAAVRGEPVVAGQPGRGGDIRAGDRVVVR